MILDGRPCEIVGIERSAPGKHGHAKFRITGIDLITGFKKQGIFTGHDKVEVPIVEKKTAQVLSVSGDKAQIMDMTSYETFDVNIPNEFKDKIKPDSEIIYWDILGAKVIKQIK